MDWHTSQRGRKVVEITLNGVPAVGTPFEVQMLRRRETSAGITNDLILFCLQSDINYPIKTRQGLDCFWSAFQFTQATFQGGLDRVHRVVIVVTERLAPHFPPDPFLRVALRAVRGQPVEREVVRHHQAVGLMPAGAIQEHENVLLGMPARDFGQVERHGRCVGVGQNQADQFAILRADATEDMRVFPHAMGRYFRAAARRCPATNRIAHAPESGFIFKEQAQGPIRVPSRHGRHFGRKFF